MEEPIIPQSEIDRLASGIKYPENIEWWDEGYDPLINKIIKTWKNASQKERDRWEDGGRAFYKHIDPQLSDDSWDYFQSDYSYMPTSSVMQTPARFFGPHIKKVIIKSLWLGEHRKEFIADTLSHEIRKAWYNLDYGDLKSNYIEGRVSREFAKAMKPWENDNDAWMAMEVFYQSGNS